MEKQMTEQQRANKRQARRTIEDVKERRQIANEFDTERYLDSLMSEYENVD